MLQVLFEMKQASAAWPIIAFLEVKLKEIQQLVQQKKNIKAQGNEQKQTEQEESKVGESLETLDESILVKNSFSIINAAYIRKHAISPKNMNIYEYKVLLQNYKAMFHLLQNDI